MAITLRSDQEDVRVKLRVALRNHQSVLAFAPTGFGKTVLSSALIQILFNAKRRVIFCVHRLALLKQTAVTLEQFGIPFSYIASGYHYNPYHRVFIASIDTLKNRLGKYPADFVFIDEAHLSASAGWSKTVEHYKASGSKIIGLSGSPVRLDGKPLGAVWDTMVIGPSVRWLIDEGHLSTYRAFSPKLVDTSSLHVRSGNYVASEVDDLVAGKAVLAGAVHHWRSKAHGKRTIGFAPSVKRAQELADEFNAAGFRFVALDAETPQEERDRAFNALADRKIDGLLNCNLFSEGFDMSAQVGRDVPIECVLDLYPTNSLARHLQKHGRGLRRKPEPAILLDLVGAFRRDDLGLPDWDREWSLGGSENGKRKGSEVAVFTCGKCFYDAERPFKKCPSCGHVEEPSEGRGGRTIKEIEGELEEIDVERQRVERKQEQAQARSLEDLVKLATARGYKSPAKWAAHIFTARQAKARSAAA